MLIKITTKHGSSVTVHENAIKTLVAKQLSTLAGVSSIASVDLKQRLLNLFQCKSVVAGNSTKVRVIDKHLIIDIFVILNNEEKTYETVQEIQACVEDEISNSFCVRVFKVNVIVIDYKLKNE